MKLCVFFITVACFVVFSHAQGPDQKACRKVFSDLNKKNIEWINQCVKQLGYKTGREKTQKSACVWKCILTNLGMLNAAGAVDQNQYTTFLKENWPANLIGRANSTLEPCLQIGSSNMDTTDEFCRGYDPLVKCLNRNYPNICRGL